MIKKIIFFLAVVISAQAFSQRSTSSPYSYFGVGEEFGTRTVEQISMGSIGAAYSSNRYLNFVNPASLSELRFATYVFGVLNNELTIKDADIEQSTNSTNLSYFSFAFPVSKKMGVIFGMQPTSSVGYSLINTLKANNGIVFVDMDSVISISKPGSNILKQLRNLKDENLRYFWLYWIMVIQIMLYYVTNKFIYRKKINE